MRTNLKLPESWLKLLSAELKQPYFLVLTDFVKNEYANKAIYPPAELLLAALNACTVCDVKVVILGQDPYHGADQANGLSFSVPKNQKLPPSLRNIYKELKSDLNVIRTDGDLADLAKQGVLFLNSILTVQAGKPASHKYIGWEKFTDAIIKQLSEKRSTIIFVLWGKYAQSKEKLVANNNHLVIKSAHPSPLSAYNGFFGSKPFSKVNNFLQHNNLPAIEWESI